MRIINLDEKHEKMFLDHVRKDPLMYYWFILDWRDQRNDTEILLALGDDGIKGMMLVFKKATVALRGNREAVAALLQRLDLETVELNAPLDCRDLVLRRYGTAREDVIILMSLEKGREDIQILHKPEWLTIADAAGISKVVREANPDWWDDVTAERVSNSIKDNLWLGIRREGRIVSVGSVKFTDIGSNIGIVATDEDFRNRGFARSIVSALVIEILRRKTRALIHALKDNNPAIHVYTSVGFRPHHQWFMIRKGIRR